MSESVCPYRQSGRTGSFLCLLIGSGLYCTASPVRETDSGTHGEAYTRAPLGHTLASFSSFPKLRPVEVRSGLDRRASKW